MNSGEGKCQMQCFKDAGIDSKTCREDGSGPEACKTCADQCFNHDNEKCLNEERWKQLNEECKGQGSGYHLEEVRGDDGYGKECVIDEKCVYSEGEEWESQEEKDRKLAEMERQWELEREEYERAQQGGNDGEGYSGGCTQPGPEGQCNPGPGAGSDGSDGSGDSGGDSGESDSGSLGSDGSSGGDGGGVIGTGAVIMRVNSDGAIVMLINYARNLL